MSVTLVHPAMAVGRNAKNYAMPLCRETRVVPSNIDVRQGPGTPTGREDLGDRIGDRNPQSKFVLQIAAKPLEIIAEWLL